MPVENLEECGFGEERVGFAVIGLEGLQDGVKARILFILFHFIYYYYYAC